MNNEVEKSIMHLNDVSGSLKLLEERRIWHLLFLLSFIWLEHSCEERLFLL